MIQAVAYGGMVHVAGQVAHTRDGSHEIQTWEVPAKIEALLNEAGSSKSKLVALNGFCRTLPISTL